MAALLGCVVCLLPVRGQGSGDFFAFYTRAGSTGAESSISRADTSGDIAVKIGSRGEFIFSREYSYLPYWKVGDSRWQVEEIVPRQGDGPSQRPDKNNRCSHARIIKNSPEKIVIHWRYAPDLTGPHFTRFKESYDGDIARYFADYVDEYFTLRPDGTVVRTIRKGCYSLKEWQDPLNRTVQTLQLSKTGIAKLSQTLPRLGGQPGKAIAGSPLKTGETVSPKIWLKFDEGLRPNFDFTREMVSGIRCPISGVARRWRSGVSGSCLSYDGYTTRVSMPARNVPRFGNNLSVEAWVAPQEYSMAWSGIVDHQQGNREAGYSLGINQFGQIGFYARVNHAWQGITTKAPLPLLKWTHVTAVFDAHRGFAVYLNGTLAGSLEAAGDLKDAAGLDLYVGMAHEKQFPAAAERDVTRGFLSNMVFSGLIDEVKILDRPLAAGEVETAYQTMRPRLDQPLQHWVLPAGPASSQKFGAAYTTLHFSPEWDGIWRVGDHADLVVTFDEIPGRFVFWRGTGYLPSLVTGSGPQAVWVNDQGPELYQGQCYEHMSDKQARFAYVRLLENTPARVVVHWHNASASVGYEWFSPDAEGRGLATDEFWTIYPDGVAVRHQVSEGPHADKIIEMQQAELINQPGTKGEDHLHEDAVTVANLEGEIETWNYSTGVAKLTGNPIAGAKNLVSLNLKSDLKYFNIGEAGAKWEPFNRWDTMNMAPDFSRYSTWNHWPVGLLPSDGTVATAVDRTSSTCVETLREVRHQTGPNRIEACNLYGLTKLPAASLKALNRSWNFPPNLTVLQGAQGGTYDKNQRAYLLSRVSDEISFTLEASTSSPLENLCLVIQHWGDWRDASLRVEGETVLPGAAFRQGIVRDSGGNPVMVLWIKLASKRQTNFAILSKD